LSRGARTWRRSSLKWSLANQHFLQHPLSAPIILVAAILTVYYPAVFSGIHSVDDTGIISLYSSSPDLAHILLPGSSYYYRPVLELSFWLDNYLWGMDPVAMHMENIALHCANSILVFMAACCLFRITGRQHGLLLPLLAALFFSLHPVNTEPVAWIAGRTDPLMSIFVLSSFYLLLRWFETGKIPFLVASAILMIAGMLTKETAFAAASVIFLLFLAWPESRLDRKTAVKLFFAVFLLGLFFLFILYLYRDSFAGSYGFARLLSFAGLDRGQGLWEGLAALGFYFRKMVAPLPLSFAITEISGFFGVAGVLLCCILVWSFYKDRRSGLLLLSAAFTLLPAIAVAYVHIAWTPFAERYLYLPLAFFTLWLLMTVSALFQSNFRMMCMLASLLLLFFSAVVLQRTILWGDKAAFIEDAIAKSPGFGSLYNEQGGLLLKQGRVEAAREAFNRAEMYNKRDSMRLLIKANQMIVLLAEKKYIGVRDSFFLLFRNKDEAPAEFLEILFKADSRRLYDLSGPARLQLAEDVIETLSILERKKSDPFWLYQSGRMAMELGDYQKAQDFFMKAYSKAPVDAHYREAVLIFMEKLGAAR